jgi:hypothetical protein
VDIRFLHFKFTLDNKYFSFCLRHRMSNQTSLPQQQAKTNLQRMPSKNGPPFQPSAASNSSNKHTLPPIPPAKTLPKLPPKVPPKVPPRNNTKSQFTASDSRPDDSEALNERSNEESLGSSGEGNGDVVTSPAAAATTTAPPQKSLPPQPAVPVRTRLGKHGSVSITSALFLKPPPPPPPPRTSKPTLTRNMTTGAPVASSRTLNPSPPSPTPTSALAKNSSNAVKFEKEIDLDDANTNVSVSNGTGVPQPLPPRMNKPNANSAANIKVHRPSVPTNKPSPPKVTAASSSGTLRLKRQASAQTANSPSSASSSSEMVLREPPSPSNHYTRTKNTSAFSRRARTLWEAEREEEYADILFQRRNTAKHKEDEIIQERLKKIPLIIPEEFPCRSLEHFTLKTILSLLDTEECYTFPGIFRKPGKSAESKRLHKEIQKLWEDKEKTKAKEMERFLWQKNVEFQQRQQQHQHERPKAKKEKKKEKEPEPLIKTKDCLALADLLLEFFKTQKEPPTAEVYEELLIADEIETLSTKAVYIRDVLKDVKEEHFVTLYLMCAFLAKLCQKEYSAKNEMSFEEMGKIFGPLLIADKEDFINAQLNLDLPKRGKPEIANKLLVFIVQHYKLIFCYDGM